MQVLYRIYYNIFCRQQNAMAPHTSEITMIFNTSPLYFVHRTIYICSTVCVYYVWFLSSSMGPSHGVTVNSALCTLHSGLDWTGLDWTGLDWNGLFRLTLARRSLIGSYLAIFFIKDYDNSLVHHVFINISSFFKRSANTLSDTELGKPLVRNFSCTFFLK